jgi:hypothetical protein
MPDLVPGFEELPEEEQERLREIARDLEGQGLPAAFVAASLRSTAEVMRDLRQERDHSQALLQREDVRRFIEENAVAEPGQPGQYHPRRERKREERERLQANVVRLLREARLSRARHEVKKTRNMLLRLDQRELRRVLGREGEELCRQINTWLRSTSSMF